jgi:glycosyltransferase involved in cell wall biosynthesis
MAAGRPYSALVPTVGLVSFRLGGGDGVSVEAEKWAAALRSLGLSVRTFAGAGRADELLPGLGLPDAQGVLPSPPPTPATLRRAFDGCDVVVVENLCSLPLNPPAADAVATALRGRPAVLHHHDLPWQRAHLAHLDGPPDDPSWRHVTINEVSRRDLAGRGIEAVTVYNRFDVSVAPARRPDVRRALGLDDAVPVVLQPTRALVRKNVAAAVALAEELGGVYWLLGPAEDGYGEELGRLLRAARCPVLQAFPAVEGCTMTDVYAACDVVALPSTWEGFGNPTVESAVHRRPLAVGPYPVARELAAFGFEWFWFGGEPSGPGGRRVEELGEWLAAGGDQGLLARNRAVAEGHFDLAGLPAVLAGVLEGLV